MELFDFCIEPEITEGPHSVSCMYTEDNVSLFNTGYTCALHSTMMGGKEIADVV